jgi:3-hexulose-6-phosphate synthase
VKPTVQLSLDLTNLPDALETAAIAIRAGVDWLEIGTPLVLAEGVHAIRALREHYPKTPLVADLKIMDGAYGEVELAAKAGADMVVIMGQAHAESIELAVRAGRDFGVKIMGDNMAMPDVVEGAKRLEDLGCDYIVHHVGYDRRTLRAETGLSTASPLLQLREVVAAVRIPVQAVGGLSIEQAVQTPTYGAPMVVIGAPLAIDAHSFRAADGDLENILREICDRVHAFPDITVGT